MEFKGPWCWVALILGAGLAASAQGQQGGGRGITSAQVQQRIADARQQMEEGLKNVLEVNEEGWNVIFPRLEKVTILQYSLEAGEAEGIVRLEQGANGRRRGRRVPSSLGALLAQVDNVPEPVAQRATEMWDLLNDIEATVEQIRSKLAELRSAKEEAELELRQARRSLVEVLTPRQEATLVQLGILE